MQLIAKPGEVYTFKLNSGEELIAKVKMSGGDWIGIEHPVSVAPGPQGMGLVPSMFTANPSAEIKLNTASVAIYALTDDAVQSKYLEATTGIQVPDKKIIMG
jgi:hypothetical protein